MWQLNVMSAVRAIRAALPHLRDGGRRRDRQRRRRRPASARRPGMPNYSVTKAALLSLSRLVADLYAGTGSAATPSRPGRPRRRRGSARAGSPTRPGATATRCSRKVGRRAAARPARRARGDRGRGRLPLLRARELRDRRRVERRRRHRPGHHLTPARRQRRRPRDRLLAYRDVTPRRPGADAFAERIRAAGGADARAARGPLATPRAGRLRPEEECRVRTPFQRDRDRILHSKPFRRLKGKTQVFIDPAGDHYRTRMTHTLETTGDRAGRRAGARPERGSHRGDRARPRHGPPAVRARGRGGARRGAARALRARLPPQRAVAADRRAAEPDRRGARRDPHAHRAAGARDARGRASCASSTGSRTSTTTSTTPSATGSSSPDDPAGAPRSSCSGETGSRRIDTLVHDLVETSAASRRHRAERGDRRRDARRCGRSCSSASTSRRPRARSTCARAAWCGGSSTTSSSADEEPAAITEFIAGMTDRFALDYAERLG